MTNYPMLTAGRLEQKLGGGGRREGGGGRGERLIWVAVLLSEIVRLRVRFSVCRVGFGG